MFVNGIVAYIVSYPCFIAFPSLVFLASLCIYWKYNKADIEERLKPHKTTVNRILKVVLILSGIFIVFGVGFYVGYYGEKLEVLQKNSLQVAYNYDFENKNDPSDIYPWTTHPKNKSYTGWISEEEEHFGNHSLRLKVDITDYNYNEIKKRDQYGSIGITNHEFSEVKAIKSWVLVPKSEQVRGITFYSHIIAFFNDSYGRNIGFFGEEEEIEPGIWTPIFLGVFYETDCENCTFKWDGTIDELYLNVYHFNDDLRYKGSIYFDDITIWK